MLDIVDNVNQILPQMIEWRRYLHQYPELSYQEEKTSDFIAGLLEQMGLEVTRNVGGHGLRALLRGKFPEPVVALRADMDALPIQDAKICSYASKVPGVMHACGHDAHSSTLLGVARLLSDHRNELPGSVVFIFQPAEEVSPGGARSMIADGVLQGVNVVYGIHLWSPFPTGHVYSKPGPIMAAADEFRIGIAGKGGHGGLPHDTVDSIVAGAAVVSNLQTIVSRNVNPLDPCVVSVGSFHGGNGCNVIAERTELRGTVRTFSDDLRGYVKERMKEVIRHTCDSFGAGYEFEYKDGYPPVVNHDSEVLRFFEAGCEAFGENRVHESPLIMAGEDFAYYLQKVPGCFMFVGAGSKEKNAFYPHHHPSFDIDEQAMASAARLFIGMTLHYFREWNAPASENLNP